LEEPDVLEARYGGIYDSKSDILRRAKDWQYGLSKGRTERQQQDGGVPMSLWGRDSGISA